LRSEAIADSYADNFDMNKWEEMRFIYNLTDRDRYVRKLIRNGRFIY